MIEIAELGRERVIGRGGGFDFENGIAGTSGEMTLDGGIGGGIGEDIEMEDLGGIRGAMGAVEEVVKVEMGRKNGLSPPVDSSSGAVLIGELTSF